MHVIEISDYSKKSKRAHKKSRQGCSTCKARRVKCDEVHPVCGPCVKRFVGVSCCDYQLPSTSKPAKVAWRALQPRPSLHPIQPPVPRSLIHRPSSSRHASDASQLFELRLMHHYTRVTCGMPTRSSVSAALPVSSYPMWEIDMPQLAFTSELVMNALMAVSSLHLSSMAPTDKKLAHASRFYLDKAVTKYRAAITDVKSRDLQSILATAVLLIHHTWLTSHYRDPTEPFTMAQHLQTFHMCVGLKVLCEQMLPPPEEQNEASTVLQEHFHSFDNAKTLECQYTKFRDAALQDIEVLSMAFERDDVSSQDRDVYEKAAEDLVNTYHFLASGQKDVSFVEQEIATMLHRLPPRFAKLLENEDPLAMAILARGIALLKVFDDDTAWWIHGTGECQVAKNAIKGISCIMPSEWLWTMEWPARLTNDEIKLA